VKPNREQQQASIEKRIRELVVAAPAPTAEQIRKLATLFRLPR